MTLSIKERKEILYAEMRDKYMNSNIYSDSDMEHILIPQGIQIELDCEIQTGHVNLETITREDGSKFYICDDCGKQVELGYE